MSKIVFHCNYGMPHQVRQAESMVKGAARHGDVIDVTNDRTRQADVHIVSGPWFAKREHLTSDNVILIDRAYVDVKNHGVSIGWMDSDGGRYFTAGEGKPKIEIAEQRTGSRSIYLEDYEYKEPIRCDATRCHPARVMSDEGLMQCLDRYDIAAGYNSTSLVTAALMGLRIDCRGKQNILMQHNWLEALPYADWNQTTIENGDLWAHLQ